MGSFCSSLFSRESFGDDTKEITLYHPIKPNVIACKYTLINDKLNGQKYFGYDQDGKLMEEKNYNENGELHGAQIDYNVGVFTMDNKIVQCKKYVRYFENGQQIC